MKSSTAGRVTTRKGPDAQSTAAQDRAVGRQMMITRIIAYSRTHAAPLP